MGRVETELKQSDPPAEVSARKMGIEWFAATPAGLSLLSAMFDAVPVAIFASDGEGRIVFYNNGATQFLDADAPAGPSLKGLRWPDGKAMSLERSPMRAALTERRAVRGAEALFDRADGTRTHVLIYATPLFEGATLIGAVNMLVELEERSRANYLEQRLAAIVECSEDAIISKDLNGTIATWNKAAERLFGYTADEAVGRPIMMVIPDDRQQEEAAILDSIRKGRPVARYETWRRRKDGTLVPIALTVSPLRDATGRIIGASKIARDITDQVRMREQQTLVLNEMSHRVKNILAVAGGLVGLSARSAQSPKAMAKAVQERLGAYSKAHELTRGSPAAQSTTRETTLHTLVHAIIAPYLDESGDQPNIRIEGDDVTIDANATASLALVLHEFTTNAAKYGALSTPSGRVTVETRAAESGLEFVWTERGGPRISGTPTHQGFGSVLATKTVEGQLDGTLRYDWQQEGLVLTMSVPRERLSQA